MPFTGIRCKPPQNVGTDVGTVYHMGKLTALQVKAAKEPGRYQDGDGLMLLVKNSGARSWLLRIQYNGDRRDFGLGSANSISLAEARMKAEDYRHMVREGVDPVATWNKEDSEAQQIPTFAEAAIETHGEQSPAWRNAKHAAQWMTTLERYAFPSIGSRSIETIEASDIRDLLIPIWLTKPETARRVRQRIGTILDWAHAKGYRPHEAPLRAINKGLPRQPRRDNHMAAMPYEDVPAFMDKLRKSDTIGRLALRFTILTAALSGEVRGAIWKELDLKANVWKIPANRMKAGREHQCPLNAEAQAILNIAGQISQNPDDPVFPGARNRPLSDMTLTKVLRDANIETFTVHGFRSSFRDWAAEQTDIAGDIVEAALAHTISNKTEAAYRRTNYLEKRRDLMDQWASFCSRGEHNSNQ